MTVDVESVLPISYTLDGVTTNYTFPYKLFDDDHLEVRLVDSAGVEQLLTLDDDYSITGVGEDQATVILQTAAGTSGKRLILNRVLPLERQTILAPGPLPVQVLDDDFDRVWMAIQQLQEQLGRSIQSAISGTVRGLIFPNPPAVGTTDHFISWSDDRLSLINRSVIAEDIEPPDGKVTTRYPEDAGLSTVDGFNNSGLLNAYLQSMSDTGGGVFRLESPDGAGYDFPDGITNRSLVTLEMVSPVTIGPTASISIQGGTSNAFEGLRLVSDATLGGTTLVVDTAPVGGGAVSAYMKVGGSFSITGELTGSGSAVESESNSITAINDGTRTITLADPLNYAYKAVYTAGAYESAFGQPNRSLINVHRTAIMAVDNTLRADRVTVNAGDVALIAAGDWVQIEDDRRTDGAATYIEIRQVIAVEEDGDNVITLNGQLRRIYLVSQNARLTVLDPAFRAAVVGGSVTFTGTAHATRLDATYVMIRCVDCVMVDCEVPNTDSVGRRGPMHRIDRSYNSHYIRPSGRNPKFLDAGEGNGGLITNSTRCSFIQPVYQGNRHPIQYLASCTECASEEVDASDVRLSGIDHHGLNNVGCYTTLRRISFSGRSASSSNGGVSFGNASFIDGDHECVVMGGVIGPFEGPGSVFCVRAYTPSTYCYAIGVRGQNVEKFWIHRDTAGSDLITNYCGMINCSVDRCSDYVIDLQGKLAGATVNTLQNFVIRDFVGTNLVRGIFTRDVHCKTIANVSLSFTSPAVDQPYALYLRDMPTLRVINLLVEGASKGIRLLNCASGLWLKCDLLDLAETEWLRDDGGNNGTEFRGCNADQVIGTPVTVDASGGSTIVYKAVSNIGIASSAAYTFTATDKLLARVSGGGGAGEEATFTDAGQAMVAAATAIAQADLLHTTGANIASAATTDLSTATGMSVTITGTTTITAFGTLGAGKIRVLTFADILLLTHNGTSLILPGAANITTAAGDVTIVQSLGAGNWKALSYVRASGSMALQAASNVAITGGTIAGITDLAIADGGTASSTARGAVDALFKRGADVPSAATVTLSSVPTNMFVDITGSTAITSLGVASADRFRLVRFTGSLTLTHNGTSLILPGAANIQTGAGDIAWFWGYATDIWVCVGYLRASGVAGFTTLPIANGGTGAITKALARVALSGGPTALSDAATIATDCALNDSFTVTLGGNRTLGAPTNVTAGTQYFWALKQDGTGSRTLALHANFIVADGETFAMKPEIAATTILAAYAETTSRLLVGFKKYA
jgi:hypothetical protein